MASLLVIFLCTTLGVSSGAADAPEIRVGVSQDFRPYAFADKNGRPVGYSIDLIQAVARAMGLRVQIKAGTWDQVWHELTQGQIDVLAIVAKTPDRESQVDFSVPHTETFDAFFVRTGQPAIPSLAAAAGKEIVVRRSDAALKYLPRNFSDKLTFVDTIPQGLALVAAGQHDAFLNSKLIGTLEMRENHIQGLTAGPPIPDYKRVFAFAVRKGDVELLEKLNQGLRIIKADGEYDRIYQRWLEVQPENPWQRWIPYFQWTLAGVAVLAALTGFLQWLVHRRTRQLALANKTISAEVSERRKAEAALHQANATLEQRVAERTAELSQAREWLRVTLGSIGDAVLAADTAGRVTFMNPVAAALTGWGPEQAEGQPIQNVFQVVNEQTQQPGEDIVTRVLREGHTFELANHTALMTRDGQVIPIEDSAAPIRDRSGKVLGVVIVFHDVTEKRRAQEAVRESQAKLKAAIESLSEAIFISDAEGRLVNFNDGFVKYHRFKDRVDCGKNVSEYTNHLDAYFADGTPAPFDMWAMPRALRGEVASNSEYRLCRKDTGESWWGSYNFAPIRDEDGKIIGSVVSARDITAHKQAESALQATLQRFYIILSSMYAAVLLVTDDGRVEFANQAFCDRFGLKEAPADLVGLAAGVMFKKIKGGYRHPDEAIARIKELLDRGQPVTGEELAMHGGGTCLRDFVPLNIDGKSYGRLWIHTDITERKQTEQALLRSEKLASVGRMAATIAHEINNPLEAVMSLLFLAKGDPELPESVRQHLEVADGELNRIAHITRQSLGFYRESNGPAPTSVNAVLESTVDLLKSGIKAKRAVIEKQWDGDVGITAVAGELRQVFSNLLANSLDAIDEKGTIKLRVSLGTNFSTGRRCVRITVADNGQGISQSSRQHIFEPFFTTKGTVGTGLGLWVSKQIVDKHAGTIRMRSSNNGERRGTVFSVVLPVSPAVAARSQTAGA